MAKNSIRVAPSKLLELFNIEELKERLSYNPDTGVFTHLVGNFKGRTAGCSDKGYIKIGLTTNGKHLQVHAHRLAWVFVHGVLPTREIDHINGNPSDNRICNLRDVSRQVNGQNLSKPFAGNRTGILGVSQRRGRYCSAIKANGKSIFLGDFNTAEEARDAYLRAKRRYHQGCTI